MPTRHRDVLSATAAGQLVELARVQGLSLNKLVTEIDSKRPGNLSSALRVYVLESYKARPVRA